MKRKSEGSTRSLGGNRGEYLALLFIFLLYFFFVALYSSHIPIGKGVDEEAHFLYVEDILKTGHLPKLNVPHGGHYESHQPPLFYILSLPIAYLGGANWRIWGRFLSSLLIAISGFICYLAGKRLFRNNVLGIASCAFVLFLPGNIAIASGFTNDSLAQALFSLSLFFLLGEEEKDWLWGGIATGGAILAKSSCIVLILAALLSLILSMRGESDWRKTGRKAIYFLLPVLLLTSWWFIRNKLLYGDFLGWKVFQEAFATSPHPSYFLERGLSWGGYWLLVFTTGFASFWTPLLRLRFLSNLYYVFLVIFLVLSICGVLKLSREEREKEDRIYLFVFSFLFLLLSFVRFNLYFFEAQGRYLYPALCSFSLLFNAGLYKLRRFLLYIFYFYLLYLCILSLSLL
ncbi:MAG: glycosyltransferase family 39 protein [bacterium]